MSRWWRAYDEALDDPKLQALGLPLIGAWFNLLCVASKNDGKIQIKTVPFALRISKIRAAEIITRLAEAGLLDKIGDDYTPHNWHERQYVSDSSTARVKRFRQDRKRFSETFQYPRFKAVSETDQNRTDKKEGPQAASATASCGDARLPCAEEGKVVSPPASATKAELEAIFQGRRAARNGKSKAN